tara:strand:+ start:65 stop:568 length:504 start_codon:yes stop_codon:yes gene_type:complete
MSYFTSWDINVFLCFLSLGLPWDLVKEMTERVKRDHEKFTTDEAREYHCMNIKPIHQYIFLKNDWERKRDAALWLGVEVGSRIKKKDLNFIREPESRKRIKHHNHYQKVKEEYNKIWNNSFPVFNPRVILLERKLMKLSDGQRKFFLENLIEKFPVEKNMSNEGFLI